MASSIIIQAGITGSLTFSGITTQPFTIPVTRITVPIAGKYGIQGAITVPTSDTTLSKGSIGTVGYYWIQNMDATNYVEIGDGTNWLVRALKNGPPVIGYWNSGTPHVRANTAACDIIYWLFEA
jgi:hypothetical protein